MMVYEHPKTGHSRREFLKLAAVSGSAACFGIRGAFVRAKTKGILPAVSGNYNYKYRTVSVRHVPEIARWFEKLVGENKIGKNETFRKYIGGLNFNYREILPDAKSIIILSVKQRISSVSFHYKGKQTDILIPTGYVDDGLTYKMAKDWLRNDIFKNTGMKIQEQIRLPLKTMSVRSGLADYGKNNITFVDEFGSFHQLLGFYTDIELDDNWRPLNMLRLCKGCSICLNGCPTKCIGEDSFIINVDKCLTLYNEITQPIPDFIPKSVHHTLVGCLKCQFPCPANAGRINDIENLAHISEEETAFLLGNKQGKKIHDRIAEKLQKYPSAKNLDYFRRNFQLAFANLFTG